jgi:5'-nucleotidase
MRVLITNDDGIDSPGLHALAASAIAEGLDVVVAGPAHQSSGSSASILGAESDGRIHMEPREIEGLSVPCFAVRAAPALIALIAAHGAFGAPPDAVLSGVNRGANVGRAVLHSGTVGAALTAGANGARGLAVSLDVGMHPLTCHWDVAARLARSVLPALLASPQGTVLNLNVPNDPDAADRPVLAATLATFGIVQTTATEHGEGEVRMTVADTDAEHAPGSDAALLERGHPTLTSITGIGEAPLPEGTPVDALDSRTAGA